MWLFLLFLHLESRIILNAFEDVVYGRGAETKPLALPRGAFKIPAARRWRVLDFKVCLRLKEPHKALNKNGGNSNDWYVQAGN